MKLILLSLLLVAVSGCRPARTPAALAPEMNPLLVAEYGKPQYIMLTNALAHSTNLNQVIPLLASNWNSFVIENLSHASPKDLTQMLKDIDDGFDEKISREQVVTAIKLHNSYPQTKKVKLPKGE